MEENFTNKNFEKYFLHEYFHHQMMNVYANIYFHRKDGNKIEIFFLMQEILKNIFYFAYLTYWTINYSTVELDHIIFQYFSIHNIFVYHIYINYIH